VECQGKNLLIWDERENQGSVGDLAVPTYYLILFREI